MTITRIKLLQLIKNIVIIFPCLFGDIINTIIQ